MTKNAQNLYNLEKHLQKDNLCFKCNNLNENINTFSVKDREFGSIFQGDKFTINLCNECQKLIKEEWFNNNPVNIENDFCFYTEEHEFVLEKYDKNGEKCGEKVVPLSKLWQSSNTHYFESPLSAIVKIEDDGIIEIKGTKTKWRYGVVPDNQNPGCMPEISDCYFVLDNV